MSAFSSLHTALKSVLLELSPDGSFPALPDSISGFLRLHQSANVERVALARLKLPGDQLQELAQELARLQALRLAALDGDGVADRNAAISALRALSWLETAQANGADLPLTLPRATEQSAVSMFKRVRAIELILRSIVAETNPEREMLDARLREALPRKQYEEALKRAKTDPLAGLMFSELVSLVVTPAQWEKVKVIFASGQFLTLLEERRTTAVSFLDDVRRIRNNVVHHKPISESQLELLSLYYEELIAPVRLAFAHGSTRVDPDHYEALAAEGAADALVSERSRKGLDVALTRATKRNTKVLWAVFVAVLALVALVAPSAYQMFQWSFRRDAMVSQGTLDAIKRNPEIHAASMAGHCATGQLSLLEQMVDIDGVRRAVVGKSRERAQANIVALAKDNPSQMIKCLDAFKRAGWDPNRATNIPVGILFRDDVNNEVAPKGYLDYLARNPKRRLGSDGFDPGQLQPTALLLAVWNEDVELTKALVKVGADPKAQVAVRVHRTGEASPLYVPALDAISAAERSGNVEIQRALGLIK
jgi:hypothetical protein